MPLFYCLVRRTKVDTVVTESYNKRFKLKGEFDHHNAGRVLIISRCLVVGNEWNCLKVIIASGGFGLGEFQ